jgi:hypothetical protein
MENVYIMYVSVTTGLLAWATIIRLNWQRLKNQGTASLYTFLAAIHVFRPIGLIALLPQHLDPTPFGFTHTYLLQVAWGDAAAAVLAATSIWAVLGGWKTARLWAIAFVVVGTADTLNAGPQFLLAIHDQTLVGALGWLILTVYVPALLVTEAILVWLLVKTRKQGLSFSTRLAPAA